jgi:hypothetical protein
LLLIDGDAHFTFSGNALFVGILDK